MWDQVGRLYAYHGDVPAEVRLLKLTEEVGEVAEAFIGMHGLNSRKGICRGLTWGNGPVRAADHRLRGRWPHDLEDGVPVGGVPGWRFPNVKIGLTETCPRRKF